MLSWPSTVSCKLVVILRAPVHEQLRIDPRHGGCNSLDVARADVADGEHAWHARLQQVRCARQRPLRRIELLARELRAGLDETVRIEREATGHPARRRQRTGHHEHVTDGPRFFRQGAAVRQRTLAGALASTATNSVPDAARPSDGSRCDGPEKRHIVAASPLPALWCIAGRARQEHCGPAGGSLPITTTSSSAQSCASMNVSGSRRRPLRNAPGSERRFAISRRSR